MSNKTYSGDSTSSTLDGQYRIVTHGGASFGYDWKGNLLTDGSTAYSGGGSSRSGPARAVHDPRRRRRE